MFLYIKKRQIFSRLIQRCVFKYVINYKQEKIVYHLESMQHKYNSFVILEFWVNEVTHPLQRDNLRAMLAETVSPNINFTILSEPLPEEREDKDCKEVGYNDFILRIFTA